MMIYFLVANVIKEQNIADETIVHLTEQQNQMETIEKQRQLG